MRILQISHQDVLSHFLHGFERIADDIKHKPLVSLAGHPAAYEPEGRFFAITCGFLYSAMTSRFL